MYINSTTPFNGDANNSNLYNLIDNGIIKNYYGYIYILMSAHLEDLYTSSLGPSEILNSESTAEAEFS